MQKRDTVVLSIAVGCGFLAFLLVANTLSHSNSRRHQGATTSTKKYSKAIPIPSGMRGVTVQTTDIESIPNPFNIGNYTDILGMAPNYLGKLELQTIARSVQVVNIDRPASEKKGDALQEVKSVTFALSPVIAEIVSKAVTAGKIHLIISSEGADTDGSQMSSVGIMEVIRGVSKEKTMRVER